MNDCIFCDPEKNELPTCIKICELGHSRLYLFREQIYEGRCILASKLHVPEFYDLPCEEQTGFLTELAEVSKTIQEQFGADKINFLSLGDTLGHVHIHIVPKKKNNKEWGTMFRFMDKTGYLSEEEYQCRIKDIREALKNRGIKYTVGGNSESLFE